MPGFLFIIIVIIDTIIIIEEPAGGEMVTQIRHKFKSMDIFIYLIIIYGTRYFRGIEQLFPKQWAIGSTPISPNQRTYGLL